MKQILFLAGIVVSLSACAGQDSVSANDGAATRSSSSTGSNGGSSQGSSLGGSNFGSGGSGGTSNVFGSQGNSDSGSGNSAWVMTSSMFISTTMPPVLLTSTQTPVPGFGTTVTPCSTPGNITTTYNPTGPIWCEDNGATNPSLCSNGYTPQFGIVSVCTYCASGRWTSGQVSVNVSYFASSYQTISCVQ